MKKTIATITAVVMLVLTGCGTTAYKEQNNAARGISEKTVMSKASEEYNAYISNLADFPVSFVYDGVAHKGFGKDFKLSSKTTETNDGKKETDFTFLHRDGKLSVTLETAFYPDHDAYEWTVYFSASGKENTAVLENVLAADIDLKGANPEIKGINEIGRAHV